MSLDTTERRIDDAAELFRQFFGREAGRGDIAKLRYYEDIALVIGKLDGVLYRIEGERQASLHRFNKADRPLLLVSSDGRQIYTLKGAYRFTQRGFEG